GDDPLRAPDQSPHDPGLARGALPGHGALPAGDGQRLARGGSPRGRQRRPDRVTPLPAPLARRDLLGARGVLQTLLLPPQEDGGDDPGDGPQRRNAQAPPARGRRVRPFPVEPGGSRLRRLVVTADDFGFSHGVNQAILRAHREGIVTSTSLMVTGDA